MLSKIDIEKELGRGINIVPFNSNNIKENSINLSASNYAWSMTDGECFINEQGDFVEYDITNENRQSIKIEILKGKSAVRIVNGEKFIILLPFSTTLIETIEVIGIDNYIGGTYHSKVGIAAQGIGHIGTMLGPNYCGHSLIVLHNTSNRPLKIKVGDTIVSVVFNTLKTSIDFKNATDNAHLDKMSSLGVKLESSETNYLSEDWKKNINEIREQMNEDPQFQVYKKKRSKIKKQKWKKYINLRNIIISIIGFMVFCGLLKYCNYIDKKNNNEVFTKRFWDVGCSGLVIFILQQIFGLFRPKRDN